MKQRFWHIEGYDSFDKIYDKKVKFGYFSDNQIKDLLKALTAKAALSFDEIVGAYSKKNTKISNEHLLIQRDGPSQVYTCGSNPHFIARVIVEDL
jgi:hypothetical protein